MTLPEIYITNLMWNKESSESALSSPASTLYDISNVSENSGSPNDSSKEYVFSILFVIFKILLWTQLILKRILSATKKQTYSSKLISVIIKISYKTSSRAFSWLTTRGDPKTTKEKIRTNLLLTLCTGAAKGLSTTSSLIDYVDSKLSSKENIKRNLDTVSWSKVQTQRISIQKPTTVTKKKKLIDIPETIQNIHKKIETPWYKDATIAEIKKAIDVFSSRTHDDKISYSGIAGLKFLPGKGVFPGKLSFSFTGHNSPDLSVCGAPWMGMYDLGALKKIQAEFKVTILNESVVLGTGSGCFAALAFALNVS
ncbi:hypothetical protein HK096_002529, partial [Nowakowskiella sp. JEL0078]